MTPARVERLIGAVLGFGAGMLLFAHLMRRDWEKSPRV